MRCLIPFAMFGALQAASSVDILLPGVSYHPRWDEEGSPNSWNYGLGGSWTYRREEDWGQVQCGGMLYRDSFDDLGSVVFLGFGVQSPTVVSFECLGGMGYWNGSGTEGLSPLWYAGVGYRQPGYSVFVDATASGDFVAAWLKLSFPLGR